jgi:hypothetical protein
LRVLLAVAIVVVQAWRVGTTINPVDCDSVQYYIGARSLVLTGDPYRLGAAELGLSFTHWRYCYPPAFAYLWAPLGLLDIQTATWVWFAVNQCLLPLLAWEIAAIAGRGKDRAFVILLWAGLALFTPQSFGSMIGQCHTVLAVLVSAGWLLARHGWLRASGLAIGLATLIKLFPLLLIVTLWLAEKRRAALAALAVVVLGMALTAGQMTTYTERFVASDAYPRAAAFNVSLDGLVSRLFRPSDYGIAVADSPALARGIDLVLLAAVGAALFRLARRRPEENVLFAAGLVAMLLAQPVLGVYHLNLLLLAAAALWQTAPWTPVRQWLIVGALLLAAIPVEYGLNTGNPWSAELYMTIHTKWGLLLLAPQLYGVLLMYAVALSAAGLVEKRSEERAGHEPAAPARKPDSPLVDAADPT